MGEIGYGTLTAAIVQSSLTALAVIDRELRVLLWNPAMERIAGKTSAEVVGRFAWDVFPAVRELLDAVLHRVLAGEMATADGIEYVVADGSRRFYDRVFLPLRDDSGEIFGVL